MGPYLGFDPADQSALHVWNSAKQAVETQKIFGFINIFLWVIGFACVMAGIVGVGNIMLVTVKERTREIGIRKALGATPWSIIKMVIIEAIFITAVAGYIGIMAGVGLTELIAGGMARSGGGQGSITMFKDPTVGLGIVFAVLGILVLCGVVAGLIPSLRATRIRPIEAMRAD
jgi:putative ABC transport system permease protein